MPVLEHLLGISQALAVYRIAESQWLLLYECLENYCAELNNVAPNQPDGLLPVGDDRLAEIDFDAVVGLYFWDTDFLAPPGGIEPVGVTGSHGWHADSDELHVEKVEDPAWGEGETRWFRAGSRRYPDLLDEGAEF